MPSNRPLFSLFAIFTVAWLLVLAGAVVIFKFIVPFTYCHCFYDGVAKGAFSTILAVIWLGILVAMRDQFVRKNILSKAQKDSESEREISQDASNKLG